MAMKLMTLRSESTCAACYATTRVSSMAWWDSSRAQVICTRCRPLDFEPVSANTAALVSAAAGDVTITFGDAGPAADQGRSSRYGDGAPSDLDDLPAHVAAWERHEPRARRVADYLDEIATDNAVVLHERKLPDAAGTIDHVVIAANGIWVIDSTNFAGRIGYRSTDWVHPGDSDMRVGTRREAKLVQAMEVLTDAVRTLTEPIGMGAVPIRPAVCFTHSHWPSRDHIETIHEVIIAPPTALGAAILQEGWVDADAINEIATQLTAGLPATAG